MDAERERAYAVAHRHAAQNDAPQNSGSGYRSRWSVDLVGLPPRDGERRRAERRDRDGERSPDRAAARRDREERTIDLVPLMRLAQEACWSRLVNRPRRVRPAEM